MLGIDDVVRIPVLASQLPAHRRARARTVGLSLALAARARRKDSHTDPVHLRPAILKQDGIPTPRTPR